MPDRFPSLHADLLRLLMWGAVSLGAGIALLLLASSDILAAPSMARKAVLLLSIALNALGAVYFVRYLIAWIKRMRK